MAAKTKPEVQYRYAGACVPVRGKKEELCGQECRLLDMADEPWVCLLDPRKPEKLQVTRKGALRTKDCIQSSIFIQNSVDRAKISKLVGGIF